MSALRGKKAFIAGAGRGIGRACAMALAEKGAEIFAVSRTEADLITLREQLPNQGHMHLAIDLAESDQLEDLMEGLYEWGWPDIVVAVANVVRPLALIGTEKFDLSPQHISENIQYILHMLPRTLKSQEKKGFGRWIGISSLAAQRGGAGQTLYAVKKNVMETLFRNIALECGRSNITANVISPGLIKTAGMSERYTAASLRKLERMNVMGRMGDPDEVAHAVAFLADPLASYVTGITLPVCGGSDLNWFLQGRKDP